MRPLANSTTTGSLCTRSRRLLLGALALSAAPLPAQFVNRAVWLGSDEEGVRRNFDQGTEYFLDRMSYVVTPPWWDRELRRFGNEVDYRLGSVTGRDFTVEGHIDHRFELGDDVAFHYHVLQGENRDTRFVRNVIGLEYALDATTALFVQGTPFADKEQIDVSVGAWLWRRDDDALRFMLTAVDAPNEKSQLAVYERAPYGLHLAGAFGDPRGLRVAFELGAQLPFEQRQLDDDERFEMQRYIGSIEARWAFGEQDRLVVAIESERTDKQLRPVDPLSPLRESFDRDFHQLRVEYWRDSATPWSIGFAHTYHSEHGRRPNDPASDLRTQRREWYGIARTSWRLGERLSLEPQLIAGNVAAAFRDGLTVLDEDRFEGKIAWNARWDFSPDVSLAVIVATQIDELAFGGGGAQFIARF